MGFGGYRYSEVTCTRPVDLVFLFVFRKIGRGFCEIITMVISVMDWILFLRPVINAQSVRKNWILIFS